MPSPPTGTVTSLFTDIEGSTALLQRLGDRTRWPRKLPEGRILVSILMGTPTGETPPFYRIAELHFP